MLVTETAPYETPIIFSNDGLYLNIKKIQKSNQIFDFLLDSLVVGDTKSFTVPFSYKIRKNSLEFRRLSLIHPRSQWNIKNFYKKYQKLILHYCTKSPASIRSPQKVASTFYTKTAWENINQYKTGGITEAWVDRYSKHSPSFFSYRGYDRLYKFFDSKTFFDLEKHFSTLVTLDVSKCFDSIYTHSLSWALKDKPFTKEHVSVDTTFAQQFDALMRHTNHNETNGIVIGPELSRIFAELIFQAIDLRTIKKLENGQRKLVFDVDYSFRRYVDDVFIFTNDDETAKAVYECYSDALVAFNLHANTAKSIRIIRPFITLKSRVTREASRLANEFSDKFLAESNDRQSLTPKKIHSKWKLTRSFISQIKALCSYNSVNYDEVSSYLISVFTERVKKLANVQAELSNSAEAEVYRDASLILLEVLYFLYSVSPSVSASYKLSTAIIILVRFSVKHLGCTSETIKQKIYELSEQLLVGSNVRSADEIDHFLPLESINILLAIRELGEGYLLPPEVINRLFDRDDNLSYFDIVSCLFYIRDDKRYVKAKKSIVAKANNKIKDLSDIRINTEKAHLLADLLSCPFVHDAEKSRWIDRLYSHLSLPQPTRSDIADFLANSGTKFWFVNWKEVDLLRSLEKKELKQAY
ncbi:antiviral reverse transcriptase Drt3b [Methylocaldum sp.]|uniref:antiviral reverse transcriptase Drt3b n=1 Tax=Methylocaldum sp. TaxID=1969727 RepID=UPI002D364C23|nr:antiviral reverse transcriptase Drt3b [Methylocaldum sp.]HYE37504.1 antiviral reverse transcriptase Drt3b [Methylocaldum sp.]